MNWPIAMVAMLVWVGVWLCLAAKHTASKEGDALVQSLARLLPAFAVATCLTAFSAVPKRGTNLLVAVLWLHHTSFWLLFLFLLSGQYFQVEAWWKIREGMARESVAATYRRLWMLTEIVPPPVALTIFLTGLRLIWETAESKAEGQRGSLSGFWLQGLVLGFSLFFWDGILGYTPIVRTLRRRCEVGSESLQPAQTFVERGQLMAHCLSWPFVFLIGVLHWNSPTVLTIPIEELERSLQFFSPGWPEVIAAIVLWLLMGLVVRLARLGFKLITN